MPSIVDTGADPAVAMANPETALPKTAVSKTAWAGKSAEGVLYQPTMPLSRPSAHERLSRAPPAIQPPLRRLPVPRKELDFLIAALEKISARRQAAFDYLPRAIAFLGRYGVERRHLERATERAAQLGCSPKDVLTINGVLSEERYLDCLAHFTGFERYSPLLLVSPNPSIEGDVALDLVRATNGQGESVYLASPTDGTIDRILSGEFNAFGHLLHLCSRREFTGALLRDCADSVLRDASITRFEAGGWRSARLGATRGQKLGLFFGLALCLALGSTAIGTAAIAMTLGAIFVVHMLMRLAAIVAHGPRRLAEATLKDDELPVYTILVALLDEVRVVNKLLPALLALDYPREKLDIKFVLEAHDLETRLAIERYGLSNHMSLLVLPDGPIRTKPRALDLALMFARGSIVTILDAEDVPEPDQLRKAAAVFAANPGIDCLQASLAPDNTMDGPVEALFTLEYAGLFDVVTNGLSNLGLPLPLGGTSNHIRRSVLNDIGGWDAFNVTEDAELGLRLWLSGRRVRKLDSITHEEAPKTVAMWFNQRRRWSKGWLQTLISQSARPRTMIGRHGLWRYGLTCFTMMATILSMLAYPLGLGLLIHRAGWGAPLFSGDALALGLDSLGVGVVALGIALMLLPPIIGLKKRGLLSFLPYLPAMPLYHLAISVACWVAIFDLNHRPFHWLKTEHGFARSSIRKMRERERAGRNRTSAAERLLAAAGLFRNR